MVSKHIKTWLGFMRSYFIYMVNPLKRKRIRRLYGAFIAPGDLCFDIGAHIGIQTRIMLDLGAKVVAVEPNPSFFNFLRRYFSGTEDLTLLPIAIAEREAWQTMHLSSIAPTVSTLADQEWQEIINRRSSFNVKWDQEIQVQTRTLDFLVSRYGRPKFIKLDIEDYEWQALQALHHPVEYISFEFFSYLPDRVSKCVQEISKNGAYVFNYSEGESFRLLFTEWKSSDEIIKWINSRSSESPSGDIFARLNN